jgi:hypothetical protein
MGVHAPDIKEEFEEFKEFEEPGGEPLWHVQLANPQYLLIGGT